MIEKIKKVLALIGLARTLDKINPDSEKDGLKRLGKGLVAVTLVAVAGLLTSQTGSGCILGEGVCKAIQNPTVASAIVAAILGAEKYANEKLGLGLVGLDSSK